ncbi:MAG: FKBP-type peptidyl-prolyl cis-trans isomerase [Thermodesulfobacteriota bacterium]
MKRILLALSISLMMMSPVSSFAADSSAAKNAASKWSEAQTLSYVFGTKIGDVSRDNKIDIDTELLLKGIDDRVKGVELALTDEQMNLAMSSFQQKVMAQRKAELESKRKDNAIEGKKFLEANKKKKGVVTTASGLQYKVIKEGSGPMPKATDKVKVHYRGTLIDGTEFDSSYKRNKPAEFGLKQVIKGWTEGLQLMKVGSKHELYIPAKLAYGKNGPPMIGPEKTLIFEVELLDIVK